MADRLTPPAQAPTPPAVAPEDAAAAAELARAAASPFGYRQPARALLARFGDGPDAARRATAALARAGVAAEPPLERAAPEQLVLLRRVGQNREPVTVAPRQRLRVAAAGLAALVAVLVASALLRGVVGDGGERASDLPPGAPAAAATTATAATPSRTTTATPSRTVATPSPDDATPAEAAAPGAGTERPLSQGDTQSETQGDTRRSERDPRRGGADGAATAPPRAVALRIVPTERSYVCVTDGGGAPLYEGILTEPYAVKRPRLIVRVGVATARITANGRPVPITTAPATVELTRRAIRPLSDDVRYCGRG